MLLENSVDFTKTLLCSNINTCISVISYEYYNTANTVNQLLLVTNLFHD